MDDVVQLIMVRFENEMHEIELKDAIDNAVERFKQHNCQKVAIPYILQTIEKYPHLEWGTPGGFAHYMEVYMEDGYVDELLASYTRKPTVNTAFLVFRCASNAEDKRLYVNALYESIPKVNSNPLREDIQEYIEWLY